MKKMLGAAVVACLLAFAGQASASTLFHSGVIDAENRSGDLFFPLSMAGLYTFKSDAPITKYRQLSVDLEEKYLGYAADGQSWGVGHFYPTNWPTGHEPIFTETANGFTLFISPVDDRTNSSPDCYFTGNIGCNYYEEWRYRITWYALLQYEDGSSGKTYDIFFDAMPTGGAIPEPATWAMLILGFGVTGAALRRRRPQLA